MRVGFDVPGVLVDPAGELLGQVVARLTAGAGRAWPG